VLMVALAGGCQGTLLYFCAVLCAAHSVELQPLAVPPGHADRHVVVVRSGRENAWCACRPGARRLRQRAGLL